MNKNIRDWNPRLDVLRIKEEVDLKILLEYEFEYHEEEGFYKRPANWVGNDRGIELRVEERSREIFYSIFPTLEMNEEDVSKITFDMIPIMLYILITEGFVEIFSKEKGEARR